MAVSLQYRNKLLALFIVAKSFLANAIAIDNVNINIAQHPNNIIIWVILFISFIILYLIVITLSIE